MKKHAVIAVVLCALFGFRTAIAEMYKWVDEKGVVHFSDTPVVNNQKVINSEQLKDVKTDGGAFDFSDEWNDDAQRYERSGKLASDFLIQHENWPEQPIFVKPEKVYVDGFTSAIVFKAKIPNEMLNGNDCIWAYQLVKVFRENDKENQRRYRITNVELAGLDFYPRNCAGLQDNQ